MAKQSRATSARVPALRRDERKAADATDGRPAPRTANLHEVDPSADAESAFPGLAQTLQLLAHPWTHVALLATAIYIQWSFPVRAVWAIVPLAISVLNMFLLPKSDHRRSSAPHSASSPHPYPATMLYVNGPAQWYWLWALFVIAPVALGVSGVLPWYFGCYVASCAAIAMTSWRATDRSSPRVGKGIADFVGESSPRATAALFNLVTFCVCFGLLTAWPYVDAQGISCPAAIASAVAWFERAVDGRDGLLGLGSLSLRECGNSYSVNTRGQMVALVGNGLAPQTLLLSAEHLHFLLLALLLCGSLTRTWLLERQRRLQSTAYDVLAVAVTAIVYLMATWWEALSGHVSPTLWPYRAWSLLCVATLWLAIRSLLSASDRREAPRQVEATVLRLPPLVSVHGVVSGLIIAGGLLLIWHEPGRVKPGRVLIDEAHSDWERADLPMVTEFYGVKTVYNYAFLKEILEKHYESVQTNRQPLSAELLSHCDVLILKTPTSAYKPEEVQAVKDFVSDGGGLWLIGDHTNIFGMNTYLNQVSQAWGIYFNADAVSPLHDFYQENVQVVGTRPYHDCGHRKHENLFSRNYLNHPIVGHNIPYMAVLTSCSVSAPLNSEYVSISRGTFADHAKFGGNTFFGNLEHDDDERYGCILQNVAMKAGRGRVAVWSDSTLFSNFAMCMSGVPHIALGYVNWLNRSNLISSGGYTAIQGSLLFLLAGAVVWGRKSPGQLVYGALLGLFLLACAVPAVDYLNTRAYALEDVRKGFRTVGFEEQYSRIELPNKDHVHQTGDRKVFESFYVMMQRLHLMPVSADRLADVASCDAIVIVNPQKDIEKQDVAHLRQALAMGRSVVLMLGSQSVHREPVAAAASQLNRLLEQLQVGDKFKVLPVPVVTDLYGQLMEPSIFTDAEIMACITPQDNRARVLLRCGEGDPVAIMRACGKGKLLLCSTAEMYSNAGIGEPSVVPNGTQAMLLRACLRFVNEGVTWEHDQRELNEAWERLLGESKTEMPGK